MSEEENLRKELARMHRVSDTLCSGHATLRDRYALFAFVLDLLILAASTWLVALAFVDPRLNITLTPLKWDGQIWAGSLSIGVFFLTLVQIKTDWKGRADAHNRSLEAYADVKQEARNALAALVVDRETYKHVTSRYGMAAAVAVSLPESEFLKQKQRHLLKVALSKALDERPFLLVPLWKVRLWWRDNLKAKK